MSAAAGTGLPRERATVRSDHGGSHRRGPEQAGGGL